MTETQIRSITEDIIQILLKKNADYGGASFDLGLNGNMVHLWDKVRRYRTLVEKHNKGESPNFESIEGDATNLLI